MPTYLYECYACGEFEYEHPITEELVFCPLCSGKEQGEPHKHPYKVKRLISGGTGFILSGGGWAREGYNK
jgi:putative FmdB family regulatory protein